MDKALNIITTPDESLTLYDLQRMVRGALESRFSDPVWISAEISELKVNNSGHCYLNLVEKGIGGGTPRAEARAMIWRSTYNSLAPTFERATGTSLRSGLKVLVRVIVSFHETYGYSLQIIDIDPSYTLGEVERRRRETIAMLVSDGVWDMNRELPTARPALRIAVVSSATAAGYRDFMREYSAATTASAPPSSRALCRAMVARIVLSAPWRISPQRRICSILWPSYVVVARPATSHYLTHIA